MQELALGLLAELVDRELVAALVQVAPEVEEGEEVRAVVGVAGVRLVGLGLLVGGPLANVLDRERRGDHDHLVGAAEPVGLEHHPAHPRVHGQLREPPAERGEVAAGLVQRAQLLQQRDAVAHLAAIRRVQEREVLDVAEVDRRHLEDHGREARAQDLGLGEARALEEVLLAVEADRDAVGRAPAAALALVGRRLRDRLDRQPLDLQPRAVARDAGGPRVDDVVDAGDGQGRLGDVRGQHDAAVRVRLPDPLLGGGGLAREQRQDLDVLAQTAFERVGGVADLALAGEEHEDVAVALAQEFGDRVADRVGLVEIVVDRPVAHLDGVGAPRHLDDRRVAEVRGEALRVDCCRRDDHLQVRPRGQDAPEVPEQEVDVQAALVRLVDDDRVVAAQQPVALDLGQQQAVGHQPQQRVLARAVGEADRVADGLAELDVELVGDPLRDGARGQPARLRVRDHPAHAAPQLEADLGQLRRLARAGLPGHDHHLVVADRGQQVLAAGAHGQRLGVGDRGHRGAPGLDPRGRLLDVALESLTSRLVARLQPLKPPAEPVLVAQRQFGEAGPQRVTPAGLRHDLRG